MYVLWRHFGITPHAAEYEVPDYQIAALLSGYAEEGGG